MSENLDKKLDDTKLRAKIAELMADCYQDSRDSSVFVQGIFDAFIDDGWRKLPSEADIQPLIDEGLASYLMTGQEWCDNFKKTIVQEAKGQSEPDTFASGLSYALKVAKKAAGIE